jgi:small subunit ribosomal protein S17
MAEAKATKSTATKKAAGASSATGSEQASSDRGMRKTQDGVVVSAKMDKTVVVAVVRQVRHKMYGKFIRRTKKYYAHDEAKACGVGDTVRIVETKPLSKLKRWRVSSVVRKAE